MNPVDVSDVLCYCALKARKDVRTLAQGFYRNAGGAIDGGVLAACATATNTDMQDWVNNDLYLVRVVGGFKWMTKMNAESFMEQIQEDRKQREAARAEAA